MRVRQWENEHNSLWPPRDALGKETSPAQISHARKMIRSRTELPDSMGRLGHWYTEEGYQDARMPGIACQTPTPAILLACKESYNVASKLYQRTFACRGSIPETYFNFETDTLCLDWYTFKMYFAGFTTGFSNDAAGLQAWYCFGPNDLKDLSKVERLAVRTNSREHPELLWYAEDIEEDIANLMRVFQGVKVLSIIAPSFEDSDRIDETVPDLQMFDAVNVEGTLDLYKSHPLEFWDVRDDGIDRPAGESDFMETSKKTCLFPEVNEDQVKLSNEQDGGYWSIPRIEIKTIVRKEEKEAFEKVRRACAYDIDFDGNYE